MSVNSLGYRVNKNPIAQSFFVEEVTGFYITKIGLYFKSTFSPTANLQLPISLHLRPMRNGHPSDVEIVPGSTVYVPYNNVNTSTDASAVTFFEFDEPIFLTGLTDYALVVYSETPEYEIWISELDGTVVGSASDRVNINPNIGSLFYSQNGATFTPDQKQDLKFEIFRAEFASSGTAKLYNASVPRKLLNNNSIQTFGGDSAVTIFTNNHGLQVNDTISISGATAVGGLTLNGDHVVQAVDHSGVKIFSTTAADSDEKGGGDEIIVTNQIPYSIMYPSIATLKPTGTSISAGFKGATGKSMAGTETPYTLDTTYNTIQLNKNNYAPHNYVIAADSIANTEIFIGAKTADIQMSMQSNNPIISPMIDLQRSSLTLIDNVIDNQDSALGGTTFNSALNFVDETVPYGGSSASKHITKPVYLAETAVGLKVIIAANVPATSAFDLYYKTGTGSESLATIRWIKVNSDAAMPNDEDPKVFRDYEYTIGGQGGTLPAFTEFILKIVFRSQNSAKVPTIKDLRAIALSV
jgi:hypothetical protein